MEVMEAKQKQNKATDEGAEEAAKPKEESYFWHLIHI